MAFRLGDRLYKEILYFYAESLSGIPLYILTQLSEATIEISAEATEYNDKLGNLVKKEWKSKAGTFTAKNAFVNMNIASATSGSAPIFASEGNEVIMPKMMHVKGVKTVELKDVEEGSLKVARYYGDGSIGKYYEQHDSDTETHFTFAGTTLTLPTEEDKESDMFFIKYLRKVVSGAKISNRADKFAEPVYALLKATYYNPCKKNELRADYIELPSFQISPEVSFPINSDSTTMDITGDLQIDYCGDERVLYNVYDADEVDAD